MLKKDRSEIYLSFDVNGKHLICCSCNQNISIDGVLVDALVEFAPQGIIGY